MQEALSLGIDDSDIASHAVAEDRVLLTNDQGFLDSGEYPDITVLCYTDNRASAYELTAMIETVTEYYPSRTGLPRVMFLP